MQYHKDMKYQTNKLQSTQLHIIPSKLLQKKKRKQEQTSPLFIILHIFLILFIVYETGC